MLVAVLLAVAIAGFAFDGPGRWCRSRAVAALDRGELSAAACWLDRAKVVSRDEAALAFLTARIERKLGRLGQAEAALHRAADLGWDRDSIEFEARLLLAQSGALADPKAMLATMLADGRDLRNVAEAFARGDISAYRLDDALGLLKVWQEDIPYDPEPHYLAGRVWEHQSNVKGAIDEFRAGLAANPRHAPSSYNLGRVLLAERKYDEALSQYRACEEVLYEPLPATLGIVRCLREMGRLDDARRLLQQVEMPRQDRLEIAYCIVGDPIDETAGKLDEEWGRLESATRDWPAAARHYSAALAAQPRNWRIRYAYATALRQQGKTEAAGEQLRIYNEAKAALDSTDRLVDRLKANPADVEARYQMGIVFLKHISENKGLFWLKSVLAYEPGHAEAHRALAEYYASHAEASPEFSQLAARHRKLATQADAAKVDSRKADEFPQ